MLRHVVLLKFAPGADIDRVTSAFAALASQIREVRSLEWGTNNSPEGLHRGFTHCFSLGFATARERDAYLVHPHHQAFSALAKPQLAEVLVIDYDTLPTRPV
ncbi:Dabb family protein [Sphaerotilaceae bacterium SBD11-9]